MDDTQSGTKDKVTPPYIGYSTFLSFFKGLSGTGVPDVIDKSLLRNMSGSNQSALVSALKWFGLLESNGKPAKNFHDLVAAIDAPGPVLKRLVEHAYPFMTDSSINLERATGSQVEAKFKAFGLNGATVVKAMAFFLAACKAAGIAMSPHVKLPKAVRSAGTTKIKKQKSSVAKQDGNNDGESDDEQDELDMELDSLLIALLQKIPKTGEEWPKEKRIRWFKTFAMNVSQVYDTDDNPVEIQIS